MLDTIDRHDFSTVIRVDQSPQVAFAAIVDPRAWWGRAIEGTTDVVGEEWTYRFKDIHYSKQRTVELVPGRRVVWHVIEGELNFIADKTEWVGTDIIFDIAETDGKTEIRFTHRGLKPDAECYEACSSGWTGLVTGSLRQLIETRQGNLEYFG